MFKRLDRRVIHKSPWLNLYQDDVEFPDGRKLNDYHIVDFEREFVACLVRNQNDEYLMVQQYRYPTNSIEWEIPGGGVDEGESLESAVQRELLEETGYLSANHELLYSYFPVNGNSNQKFNIFRCDIVDRESNSGDEEIMNVEWRSKEKIISMIKQNEITDGYSLVAFLIEFSNIK